MWSSDGKATSNWTVFIGVGVACALLVVLLMAALYLLRIKQKKGEWDLCFLSGLSSQDGPWVHKYTRLPVTRKVVLGGLMEQLHHDGSKRLIPQPLALLAVK